MKENIYQKAWTKLLDKVNKAEGKGKNDPRWSRKQLRQLMLECLINVKEGKDETS